MSTQHSIPTLGYPSRKAAIIALYEDRIEQREIVRRIGCTRYAVSSAICEYRQRTGRYIEPAHVAPVARRRKPVLDIDHTPVSYAMLNYRKSVMGARQALEAMGL